MTIDIPHKIRLKITLFSNKIEINNKHSIIQTIYHQMMTNIIKQMFLHHTHKNIVPKNLDKLKHLKIKKLTHKTRLIYSSNNHCTCNTQLVHNPTNQHNHKIRSVCNSYQSTQIQKEKPLPCYLQQNPNFKGKPSFKK